MNEVMFCPFKQSLCNKLCGLAVKVGDGSACAIAVLALAETNGCYDEINRIPIEKEDR